MAKVPPKPIDGGLPGFGLMADVLIKKYAEHLSLHRIREIYKRHGPDIPVSTLADWVTAGSESAYPIAQAVRRRMLSSGIVQVDSTPLTVLDRDKPGGTKRGHMCAMLGDDTWVVYDWAGASRRARSAGPRLESWLPSPAELSGDHRENRRDSKERFLR